MEVEGLADARAEGAADEDIAAGRCASARGLEENPEGGCRRAACFREPRRLVEVDVESGCELGSDVVRIATATELAEPPPDQLVTFGVAVAVPLGLGSRCHGRSLVCRARRRHPLIHGYGRRFLRREYPRPHRSRSCPRCGFASAPPSHRAFDIGPEADRGGPASVFRCGSCPCASAWRHGSRRRACSLGSSKSGSVTNH